MTDDYRIPELDEKGLREFGLTTGIVFVVIFGLVFPWLLERNWPVWPWIVAALLWLPVTSAGWGAALIEQSMLTTRPSLRSTAGCWRR